MNSKQKFTTFVILFQLAVMIYMLWAMKEVNCNHEENLRITYKDAWLQGALREAKYINSGMNGDIQIHFQQDSIEFEHTVLGK